MAAGRVVASLLARGAGDWVMMAEVVSVWITLEGLRDPVQLRERSLDVAGRLLRAGLMDAGYFDGEGFVSWDLDPDRAVARMAEEWDGIAGLPGVGEDNLPGLGDVCWLANTPEGNEIGNLLLDLGYREE